MFEHAGATDPIVATLAPHTITNAVIDAFVASAPSTEPIVAVDWVRESEVGGVLEVVERATGATRFLHDGPRDAGHKLGAIETTDNHPFYVADRGWTRVDELTPGDQIRSADGTVLTVVTALWTTRVETVYNFGVDGYHTYFVGEVGAWVHNCTVTNTGGSAAAKEPRFAALATCLRVRKTSLRTRHCLGIRVSLKSG